MHQHVIVNPRYTTHSVFHCLPWINLSSLDLSLPLSLSPSLSCAVILSIFFQLPALSICKSIIIISMATACILHKTTAPLFNIIMHQKESFFIVGTQREEKEWLNSLGKFHPPEHRFNIHSWLHIPGEGVLKGMWTILRLIEWTYPRHVFALNTPAMTGRPPTGLWSDLPLNGICRSESTRTGSVRKAFVLMVSWAQTPTLKRLSLCGVGWVNSLECVSLLWRLAAMDLEALSEAWGRPTLGLLLYWTFRLYSSLTPIRPSD